MERRRERKTETKKHFSDLRNIHLHCGKAQLLPLAAVASLGSPPSTVTSGNGTHLPQTCTSAQLANFLSLPQNNLLESYQVQQHYPIFILLYFCTAFNTDRTGRRQITHALAHYPNDCSRQDWVKAEARASNSIWVSHGGNRSPKTYVHHCLPNCKGKELDGKWSSCNTNLRLSETPCHRSSLTSTTTAARLSLHARCATPSHTFPDLAAQTSTNPFTALPSTLGCLSPSAFSPR